MIGNDIFANINQDQQYNKLVDDSLNQGRNYESPFGVNSSVSGQASAQDISHQYMKMKQRRPFVIEYYRDAGDKNPTSITMYINPERLTISNSKLIGKQITRGGIFYHHHGADHSVMSLSGTTGLAGMAGIKQLEEIYYASGTLLRYKNYTPVQIYGSVESFNTIDYSDPLDTLERVMSGNFSNEMITNIQSSLLQNSKSDQKLAESTVNVLDIYKTNQSLSKFANSLLPDIYSKMTEWEQTNDNIDYRSYYQKMLSSIKSVIPEYNDKIITDIAYELSLNKLYKDLSTEDQKIAINNTKKDTVVQTVDFEKRKRNALLTHIENLKNFYYREQKIRDQLKGGLINMKDDMTDPWLPRQLIIYFENRAYVGHFDTFQYSRDAKLNLINYEMKYTITKQYEFNNLNDPLTGTWISGDSGNSSNSGDSGNSSGSSNSNNSSSSSSSSNSSNSDLYTVQSGDTLQSIAKKFYGDSDYWMDIYAHNISKINNPNLIITGMQLKIPAYSKSVRYWVVSSGDNLWTIARRFYGDGSQYHRIVSANPEIKNPNLIYPKQVLKIVL